MTPEQAAVEYLLRKYKFQYPSGRLDHSKWYPDITEEAECCKSIREPSRAYPWSLSTHCRSLTHIATKYGLDEKEIRKFINKQLPCLLGLNEQLDKIIANKLNKE